MPKFDIPGGFARINRRVFSIRTLVAAKSNDMNKALINRIIRDHQSNFLSTDYLF